jgi:hypothetical protein
MTNEKNESRLIRVVTIENRGAGPSTRMLPRDAKFGDVFTVKITAAESFALSPGPAGVFVRAGNSYPPGQLLRSAGKIGDSAEIVKMCGNRWLVQKLAGAWKIS